MNKKRKILFCLVAIVAAVICIWAIGRADEKEFYKNTWTVGPERWFKNGIEVPAGTVGAISGDELARMRIAIESQPPDYLAGPITGLSWWQRELIEAKVEYLKNAGKIYVYPGGSGFQTRAIDHKKTKDHHHKKK